MSKDKRKKKFFQGMEHLAQSSQPATIGGPVEKQGAHVVLTTSQVAEHQYVRKDLIRVLVLVFCLLLVLVALMVLDWQTSVVKTLSEHIYSLIIR